MPFNPDQPPAALYSGLGWKEQIHYHGPNGEEVHKYFTLKPPQINPQAAEYGLIDQWPGVQPGYVHVIDRFKLSLQEDDQNNYLYFLKVAKDSGLVLWSFGMPFSSVVQNDFYTNNTFLCNDRTIPMLAVEYNGPLVPPAGTGITSYLNFRYRCLKAGRQ